MKYNEIIDDRQVYESEARQAGVMSSIYVWAGKLGLLSSVGYEISQVATNDTDGMIAGGVAILGSIFLIRFGKELKNTQNDFSELAQRPR